MTFAILIGAGASLGVWNVIRQAPRGERTRWGAAALMLLAGCLAGARLGFALLHFNIFASQPEDIIKIWHGGLFWPGAAAGGLLTGAVTARCTKTPPAEASERLLEPLLAPVCMSAWLGCLAAGWAYGPTAPPEAWWGLPTLDETGSVQARLPLQILAAISLAGMFLILETMHPRKAPPNAVAAAAGLGTSAHTLIYSMLRADPIPAWLGVRIDAWAAAVLTLAAGWIWLRIRFHRSER